MSRKNSEEQYAWEEGDIHENISDMLKGNTWLDFIIELKDLT